MHERRIMLSLQVIGLWISNGVKCNILVACPTVLMSANQAKHVQHKNKNMCIDY